MRRAYLCANAIPVRENGPAHRRARYRAIWGATRAHGDSSQLTRDGAAHAAIKPCEKWTRLHGPRDGAARQWTRGPIASATQCRASYAPTQRQTGPRIGGPVLMLPGAELFERQTVTV